MGFAIAIANPATEAWRWTKVKRKTDRDDADQLAKLASMNQLAHGAHASAAAAAEAAIGASPTLAGAAAHRIRRTRSARSSTSRALALPRGTKCWTKAGIEQMRLESKEDHRMVMSTTSGAAGWILNCW